jgi:hypothetical protein
MIDWSFDTGQGRAFTPVGGRILRVDETYLYLQTLGPSPRLPRPQNTLVTRLGLQLDWQKIALFDIDRIYEARWPISPSTSKNTSSTSASHCASTSVPHVTKPRLRGIRVLRIAGIDVLLSQPPTGMFGRKVTS